MTCIICDDEPLAVSGMKKYISEIPFLELKACFSNTVQLREFLQKNAADLLLLDIEMPGMNGIQFLRTTENNPITILITAYPNFALQGYELNVMDYLLKPVSFDRFTKAAEKARDYFALKSGKEEGRTTYFFIRYEGRQERIYFEEILFVQAMQNYVVIHTAAKKYITHTTLKTIEEQLPEEQFLRTHKSFIVAKKKVRSFSAHELIIGPHSIPVSRNLKAGVMERMKGKG